MRTIPITIFILASLLAAEGVLTLKLASDCYLHPYAPAVVLACPGVDYIRPLSCLSGYPSTHFPRLRRSCPPPQPGPRLGRLPTNQNRPQIRTSPP